MRSAPAKSRRRRAACRSAIRRSISPGGTPAFASSARRSERTPRTRSKWSKASRIPAHVRRARLAGVDRRVEGAHQVEHHPHRAGGVQVGLEHLAEGRPGVGHAFGDRGVRLALLHEVETGEEVGQPPQRLVGLLQAVPGEHQLLAVVGREQQVAERRRAMALGEHLGDRELVAERLRHLLLVDQQVLDVEPEAGERAAGRPLALGDLVLVVREHEVDAAGVQVDGRLAEQPQRHRRALDVPAGTPGTEAEVPARLARPGRLPEDEVAGVLLVVVVRVHARARLDPLVVEARQPAVLLEGRDLVVGGPLAAVGVAGALERLDDAGHRLQVRLVGGARALLNRLEAERLGILEECGDPLVGVLAQRHAGLLRPGDRAVVHVGEVRHLADVPAHVVLQRAAEDVAADEGAEVADVRAVVDGGATGVHPHRSPVGGRKFVFPAAQRVVQAHRSAPSPWLPAPGP